MYSDHSRSRIQISKMRSSIFTRLMLYLSIFFLILCSLTYFALTSYFEVYYTQSRTDALIEKTKEVLSIYNQDGLTPELQSFVDLAEEEGTVIQIIQKQVNSAETSLVKNTAAESVQVDQLQWTKTTQTEKLGSWVNSQKLAASENSQNGSGSGAGHGEGMNAGEGSGNGTGNGSGNAGSSGSGMENSLENQVDAHQNGESFVMILGNSDHQVEWLSYKEVAADGSQIVGRIPLYSVNEVIAIVQKFLLIFLIVIFSCSLIFAYFFTRGISKPIIRLNRIAKEMGNLNFTEKYIGHRKDEIGQLGETLNHISDELETTIEKLQGELNKERTLDKMRQRFTAQVSHEIQTPLAVIKSYAEALEDGVLENQDEESEYYITIQKETDKISGIANDLLDLSQIESGAYRLKKEKVPGFEVISSVIDRFRNTYPEKNIILKDRCEPELIIEMDRKRIEQVFYNLMSNAIKHVRPEDGIIEVECELCSGQWVVSVYNTGNVIPESELDQIWKYFYKGESDKKGTGLGLAIVKGIIECHGGKVEAVNRENGVRFEVALPL
ncbi:HAMP domain-containing protein [Acetobacterium paludosum]|uniref:histidine kinase n=2 Tax=Acetobacterium paludosum TaxID=52693 RepID=A0A923KND0_9FIRM|nr:HAMP domain-containing sensor histidine kinase [Acetobacterium paludosum]MBC3886999.1 HAMP domain-containing protein [Acetobacterium paludosum]